MNTTEAERITFEKIIFLTLTKAKNISKRAGIGWAALDKKGNLILSDAVMAGVATAKLAHTIKYTIEELHHLIITIEPVQGVFQTDELINSIEGSTCKILTIAHRTPNDLIDPVWRNWRDQWRGVITYLPETYTASSLALGIENTKIKSRPWVTAICAANISSTALPLERILDEFGVKENIAMYVMHSRALLYSSDQAKILDQLPDVNFMEEPLPPYEIYNQESIHSLLKLFAKEMRCSATLLCNLETLNYLTKYDLVDEIIYHIAGFDKQAMSTIANNYSLSASNVDLSGWQPISCAPAGYCCRIVLRKQNKESSKTSLKLRLN